MASASNLFGDFLVGGGLDQATLNIDAFRATEEGSRGRAAGGLDLLRELKDLQRNPFNLVAALQASAAAGGGTLGPASALFASGGKQDEDLQLSTLIQQLIGGLGEFALGEGNAGNVEANQLAQQAAQNAAIENSVLANQGVSLHEGGVVPGVPGQEVAAVLQAGETVLPTQVDGAKQIETDPGNRGGLPPNIQRAIEQFEAGLGSNIGIMQSVKDSELSALNDRQIAKRAIRTRGPETRKQSPIEAIFDPDTVSGGPKITSPQLIEATIRNAIGKRQTKRGARNQVLTSVVGQAINGGR